MAGSGSGSDSDSHLVSVGSGRSSPAPGTEKQLTLDLVDRRLKRYEARSKEATKDASIIAAVRSIAKDYLDADGVKNETNLMEFVRYLSLQIRQKISDSGEADGDLIRILISIQSAARQVFIVHNDSASLHDWDISLMQQTTQIRAMLPDAAPADLAYHEDRAHRYQTRYPDKLTQQLTEEIPGLMQREECEDRIRFIHDNFINYIKLMLVLDKQTPDTPGLGRNITILSRIKSFLVNLREELLLYGEKPEIDLFNEGLQIFRNYIAQDMAAITLGFDLHPIAISEDVIGYYGRNNFTREAAMHVEMADCNANHALFSQEKDSIDTELRKITGLDFSKFDINIGERIAADKAEFIAGIDNLIQYATTVATELGLSEGDSTFVDRWDELKAYEDNDQFVVFVEPLLNDIDTKLADAKPHEVSGTTRLLSGLASRVVSGDRWTLQIQNNAQRQRLYEPYQQARQAIGKTEFWQHVKIGESTVVACYQKPEREVLQQRSARLGRQIKQQERKAGLCQHVSGVKQNSGQLAVSKDSPIFDNKAPRIDGDVEAMLTRDFHVPQRVFTGGSKRT